jgi:hypothetical protein
MTTTGRTLAPILLAAAIGCSGASGPPGAAHGAARFETTDFRTGRWFKGNTHTHTLESDGDSPPDVVINWYRNHGYNFLVLSDHNVFVNPARFVSMTDSAFILIPGEELTSAFEKKPVHVNGLNIDHVIAPRFDSTLLGTVQKNVDAIREATGVPHINHPNFGWAISQSVLERVQRDKLIEIHNGHPTVHNAGGGDSPGMEAVWDHLLTLGRRMYGIAVDDAHTFKGEFTRARANPGRGWIVVRTERLDAGEIMRAMEAGRFYASSGPELDSLVVADADMQVYIHQRGDFKFTTEFVGDKGRVLKRTGANPASYRLDGDESYVRARVIDSSGEVAWIQPVFVTRP